MQKKKWISGIIIAVIILLVLIAVWLFTTGMRPKDDKEKEQKDIGNDIPTPPASGGNSTSPGGPVNPTSVKCTNDAFPLGVGSRNQCVVALQKALGISQDGIFGQQTKAAVNAKGYVVPLTHADFDKIINVSYPASWKPGDSVYLKGFGASLDVYMQHSQLGMKRIGAINNYFSGAKKIGKYVGMAWMAGYSAIVLDQAIAGEKNVYVRTDGISKNA